MRTATEPTISTNKAAGTRGTGKRAVAGKRAAPARITRAAARTTRVRAALDDTHLVAFTALRQGKDDYLAAAHELLGRDLPNSEAGLAGALIQHALDAVRQHAAELAAARVHEERLAGYRAIAALEVEDDDEDGGRATDHDLAALAFARHADDDEAGDDDEHAHPVSTEV